MTTQRLQLDPRSFGRRRPFAMQAAAVASTGIGDDLKLFATTYCAGFFFVLLYLA